MQVSWGGVPRPPSQFELARPLIVGQEFEVTVPGEANGGMGRRNLKTDGGLCTSKNSALFLFMYVL